MRLIVFCVSLLAAWGTRVGTPLYARKTSALQTLDEFVNSSLSPMQQEAVVRAMVRVAEATDSEAIMRALRDVRWVHGAVLEYEFGVMKSEYIAKLEETLQKKLWPLHAMEARKLLAAGKAAKTIEDLGKLLFPCRNLMEEIQRTDVPRE